jgi:UDP-glucuronate decarboxylase
LCERFFNRGANIICVDNYFTGTRHNIEALLSHSRFEVIRRDA